MESTLTCILVHTIFSSKGRANWIASAVEPDLHAYLGGICHGFAWQEGYGAFTIGESNVAALRRYIANQHARHRTQTFEEEYVALLEKYQIPYDPRYVFD